MTNVEFADLTFTRETAMAKPTIALTELVEKGADADLLKQMIPFGGDELRKLRDCDSRQQRRNQSIGVGDA